MDDLIRIRNELAQELDQLEGVVQTLLTRGASGSVLKSAEADRDKTRKELEDVTNYHIRREKAGKSTEEVRTTTAPRGSNRERVLYVIQHIFAIRQKFTKADIKKHLKGEINEASFRNTMNRLGGEGKVEYVRKGVGKRPSVWQRIV